MQIDAIVKFKHTIELEFCRFSNQTRPVNGCTMVDRSIRCGPEGRVSDIQVIILIKLDRKHIAIDRRQSTSDVVGEKEH